jgi:polar amino acid transport system substrate-binding protein
MTVVTEDDFRPFEFIKDGKPTGFNNKMIDPKNRSYPCRHESVWR